MFPKQIVTWLLVALLAVQAGACRKKKSDNVSNNPVPSIPVNIKIYPNDPFYFKLQTVGGWAYVNGGINGLVVYRKSNEEFIALERSSTVYPTNAAAKVVVLDDNFTLRDTVSNSRWQIIDGSVTKGPAEWPLRQYGTTYDGNLLNIIN